MDFNVMEEIVKSNIETELINAQGPPKHEYSGCCAPCSWYAEQPLKRWRFVIFLLCSCLTIMWLFMYFTTPLNPQPYVFSGVVVIVMSLWALNHFRILTKLTEQVDRLCKLNSHLAEETRKFRREVVTLSKTEQHLAKIQVQLKEANNKLKSGIIKFQELDQNLRTISASNIKGIETIQRKSGKVSQNMIDSLVRYEKTILHSVYDSLEWDNKMAGLDKNQFNMFWKKLPKSYYRRWLRTGHTFEELAGPNGILDYDHFAKMVDDFARQEALSGGSK